MTGIILLGSECTGTKITADAIVKCMDVQGVVEGFPDSIEEGKPLLYRKSHPHGRPPIYPVPSDLVKALEKKGCDNFKLVITTREFYSIVKSHQRQDKDNKEDIRSEDVILKKVRNAYLRIYKDLLTKSTDMEYFISNYESLINDPESHLKRLAQLLKVDYLGLNVKIRNENKKYN